MTGPMRAMAHRILHTRAAALLAGAAALLIAAPAGAQQLSAGGLHPTVEQPLNTTPRVPPPPAIPGARPNGAAVAPPERPPSDMQPTDALFDAINRGDLPAARDALNRGADLHGQNVLGMTPLELSVDLGRNDISFLLLSMRGDDGSGRSPPATAAAQAAPAPTARAERGRRGREQAVPIAAPVRPMPVQPPAAPQRAQLFAGDGGTPVPQAGFLGFDAARPAAPQ